MTDRHRNNWRGYLFAAPASIYLAVFSLLPVLVAGYLSLHRWHLLKPDHPFVGAGNYLQLARDPLFRNAIWNTLVYTGAMVPLGVGTALLVAMLASRPLRAIGVFRVLYYIPAICSQVAISMVFVWIMSPEIGLINSCIGGFNELLLAAGRWVHADVSALVIPTSMDFLKERGWAMASLVALGLWVGLGPRMIIFVAGLQNIPQELYEAAEIDGCSPWQKFRFITVPQLAPTILFVAVTTTIAALQLFTPVYVITQGGPQRTTDVVSFHIYREAWQRWEVGMASAQSYVLFAMILVASALQLAIMRRGLSQEVAS
jgi:multiple sugar transport system permease protein